MKAGHTLATLSPVAATRPASHEQDPDKVSYAAAVRDLTALSLNAP